MLRVSHAGIDQIIDAIAIVACVLMQRVHHHFHFPRKGDVVYTSMLTYLYDVQSLLRVIQLLGELMARVESEC